MISAADGIVHYDVTRIALIEALGDMPLGAYLTLEARARFADALLAQMPVASDAGFYMEGVKAERERIRQRLVCCRECGEIHGDQAHAEHYLEGEYDHPGSSPWQAAGPGALAHLDKLLGDGPVP